MELIQGSDRFFIFGRLCAGVGCGVADKLQIRVSGYPVIRMQDIRVSGHQE
jgi:hypothetical protein